MFPKLVIFVFVVLCCELCVESLKAGSPGVCLVKSSTRKTRVKPINVAINKWCGHKKCVVRRTKLETYISWNSQLVCCSGWLYRSEDDSCAPFCSTGCNGGRCIAPDTCICDPPALVHPEQKNTCILPECSLPCVNSQCINNSCVCDTSYEQFNSTHCYKCDPGYNLTPNFTCVKCECPNGSCVNNTCVCDEGYSLKEGICEPQCDACNGKCVAPNNCQCLDGYKNVNGTCEPKCGCETCKAPNVCDCPMGYDSGNDSCTPICKDCDNGYCSAPNVCLCKQGFMKNSAGVCEECSEVCTNCNDRGECIEETCRGAGPIGDKKRCCKGYLYIKKTKECRPRCVKGCKNGVCVAPDECECKLPLVLRNGRECVMPTCDSPCQNGTCVAGNKCACFNGFENLDNLTCVPRCDPPCINGHCKAPNKCTCRDGYKPVNETTCEPICNACDNGECVAPNDCKCNAGYYKRNDICVPDCKRPCANGICSEPDKCSCNLGYRIDPIDRYTCHPVCESPCVNASCVAPNTCSCLPGYVPVNETICSPKCDNCINGDCIAPNECRCKNGYEKKNEECVPKCYECNHGTCVAPNKCVCEEGFALENGSCRPVCNPGCVNGICVAPNQCECFAGFKAKDNVTCVSNCGSCENGRCLDGGVCFCNENYTMVEGVCSPKCSVPCVNGKCVAPNECECDEGFIKNMTVPSKCFRLCEYPYEFVDGNCTKILPVECSSCEGGCSDGECKCIDGKECFILEQPSEVEASTRLAGLELSWLLGGVVGIALLTLVVVVMGHLWRKRRDYGVKTPDTDGNNIGSVVYTVPDTLLQKRGSNLNVYGYDDCDDETEPTAEDPLQKL